MKKPQEDWPGKDKGEWSPEAKEIMRRFFEWFNEYFRDSPMGHPKK